MRSPSDTSLGTSHSDPISPDSTEMPVASEGEIFAVHATIHNYQFEVEPIDIKTQDLFREVQQLRTARVSHLDAIAEHRGWISMARRAPDDVLALIFEHGAAGGWANAPLVVSHVCVKWRRASLAPRVWSHIHLNDDSLDPIAKTRLWLSRALQSPLCVTVDVRVINRCIIGAFELLLEHAPQWRTVTLNTRFAQQANDIVSQCNRPFPYLHILDITSFSIGIATEQGVDELTGLDDAFADAPSLSYARIVSNRFPASVPQTVVDLSLQLSDVVSSRPSLFATLEMLGSLPALRSLSLVIPIQFAQIIYSNDDPARRETYFRRLERLVIDAPPDFNAVLQLIQPPALQFLHLRSIEPPLNHPHQGTGEALLQFIKASSPTIKLLELHDVDIRRDDFVQCFLSLPLLEELRLHETEISDDTLLSLHGPTGACPRLKRLDLRRCEQLAGRALVDLVRSRIDPTANQRRLFDPIEEITVINCALVDESSVFDLAQATVCNVVVRNLEDHCRTPSRPIVIGSSAYRLTRLSRLL
jgi:hypothetical protein